MSGSKRKSSYRKAVTETYDNDLPEPQEGELIVKILGNRGHVFEIQLEDGQLALASLPNKFKNLIWIKRNDYVITSQECNESGTRFEIRNILSRDQVKHLKKKGIWPTAFKLEVGAEIRGLRSDMGNGISVDADLMPDYKESVGEEDYSAYIDEEDYNDDTRESRLNDTKSLIEEIL